MLICMGNLCVWVAHANESDIVELHANDSHLHGAHANYELHGCANPFTWVKFLLAHAIYI